ncbi:MAG TPA: ferrochelatase [Bryobacteraceae bacterium]|nr:ferrochelatase [Bryobacteraceae bacterium]
MDQSYDALLVVSFGGPERNEDVLPFLENVLRGRNVPRERMLEVAEHYYQFSGKSPINDQVRALIAALERELAAHGPKLPIYWGNRNWHPMLADTVRKMQSDGVRRALAFVTSAFGSYSGCRQYREDIERARTAVGDGAPEIFKLRTFHNHPGFIQAAIDHVREAFAHVPEDRRAAARLVFTAHSIPQSMAESSPYVKQLRDACGLVAEALGRTWALVYQSRSGPPQQPWLEPDICDAIRGWHAEGGLRDLVILPIGFLSDHLEVKYDLDTQAAALCNELGVGFHRAATAGVHPAFVSMIRELILEQTEGATPRYLGVLEIDPALCNPQCCAAPQRPTQRPA